MIRILLDRAFDNERHYIHAVGLSTDMKPTTGIITGSKFVAVDTGAGYLFDETAGEWNENQQLTEAVAAYLDEHPEAIDQAAIEAMFGDQLDGIESDLSGLKSAIAEDENLLFDTTEVDVTTEITPTLESGYFRADGSFTGNSSYQHTEIIPASEGDIIYGSATVQEGKTNPPNPCYIRFLAAYNGQTIVPSAGDDTGLLRTYTVPAGVDGVRLSINLGGYVPDTLIVHHTHKVAQKNIKPELTAYNALFGKKWAHCGDSFSDYTNKSFDSGVFANKNKTFPRLIAERNNMNLLQDFMYSGRTLAYPSDGAFVNALTAPGQTYNYQNIPADVDYVTIMLGINDCQHTGSGSTGDGEDATGVITLGTIDDTTINTYYGAYNTVLSWLRTNRPFAHVGIVVTNGTTRQDYTEAQIAVAKKWGYPYINLNGDERTPAFLRAYNPNLPQTLKDELLTIQGVEPPNNTHPNWQTHKLESTIIESWLQSL